jgi:hypothetical protein
MQMIWKYTITHGQPFVYQMPACADIVAVQTQDGTPTMWALVRDDWPMQPRRFAVVGTGWDIDFGCQVTHVGTWQQESFVWHLLELLEGPF